MVENFTRTYFLFLCISQLNGDNILWYYKRLYLITVLTDTGSRITYFLCHWSVQPCGSLYRIGWQTQWLIYRRLILSVTVSTRVEVRTHTVTRDTLHLNHLSVIVFDEVCDISDCVIIMVNNHLNHIKTQYQVIIMTILMMTDRIRLFLININMLYIIIRIKEFIWGHLLKDVLVTSWIIKY